MTVDTADRLAGWRARVERHVTTASPVVQGIMWDLLAEVEHLTGLVTTVKSQEMFYRFHCFDGIRDDRCPACGGRVRLDDSDPQRLRILSSAEVRAS